MKPRFKGLTALAFAAVLGLALPAASLLATSGPATAATPPGVLVVGQVAEPKSLDPQVDTSANDFRILLNLYDGLAEFKPGTLQVQPALAKSWDISKDGLTYTFHLRSGVTFTDGTPFNAAAVKFTFERMLDKTSKYYDTGPFPLSFLFSSISDITVIDPMTIKFTLKEPFAPLLANLASPTGAIVSPTAVAKYGKDFGRHPVGTGAFKFDKWVPNQSVVLSANKDYWDGAPKLKAVIFRPITDGNTRVAEMLSGGIDVLLEPPADDVATFAKNPAYKVVTTTGPHDWFVILNMKDGIFSDKRARQAVNYAVNKKAIVEDVLQNTAGIAAGPIPGAFKWAHNPDVKPYPYDPDKARALLKAAGDKGKTLTFYVTSGGSGMLDPVPMGTAIQADLAKVGLNVKIQTFEWNTFLSKVNAGLEGKADMAEMSWMTSDPDTLPYLTLRTGAWPSKGGFNSGYYSNPKVDALLEKARTSTSQDERAALYKQVDQIVHDDAPWLFVANWKQNAVTTANVHNFALQPTFYLLLHDVTKD